MTERLQAWAQRWRGQLAQPHDIAAIAFFRIAFGVLGCISATRFLLFGWVDQLFVKPAFHFKYWGFGWVQPLPGIGMHLHMGLLAVLSLLIALGLFYRVSIVLFFFAFTYLQLIDVSTYLNHYYLVSLLALLLCFVPAHRAFSLDVRRQPALRASTLPRFYTTLLRFQIGVVYVFAGLAKLGSDWLLHAQPLNIWLSSRTNLPVIGPWLSERWVAFAFSWAGFLYDTTIVFFLMNRRTRLAAYAVVLLFHGMTSALFPIGMFPAIMSASALIFFSPGWPRRLLAVGGSAAVFAPTPSPVSLPGRRWLALAAIYGVIQIAVPLRHHLYPGAFLWHEQGMRFAWKVMVREKNGSITFVATSRQAGRQWHINPANHLAPHQLREMASQPDLILQMAHHLADQLRRRGHADVEIRVEAPVSLNGRRAAPLIDPTVDLARVRDGLATAPWILPAPQDTPIALRSVR